MAKILVYVDEGEKARTMERKPTGHGVDLAMASNMTELAGLLKSDKDFDLVILDNVDPQSRNEIKRTIEKIKEVPVLFFDEKPEKDPAGQGKDAPVERTRDRPKAGKDREGRKAFAKQSKADEGIEAGRRFMDENFYRQMSLEEIASVAGISTSYFCRRFKQMYSLTPIGYLKELRIKRACHLLEHTNEPLAEVTGQSGFFSIPYFCREFKKIMGMPPIEYRKRHAGKK
ncbi:MAG: AraC family transcriptional regulator [bacterium]